MSEQERSHCDKEGAKIVQGLMLDQRKEQREKMKNQMLQRRELEKQKQRQEAEDALREKERQRQETLLKIQAMEEKKNKPKAAKKKVVELGEQEQTCQRESAATDGGDSKITIPIKKRQHKAEEKAPLTVAERIAANKAKEA